MAESNEIAMSEVRRVRRDFYLRGKSVAEWAREESFDVSSVYLVLSGKSRATRGKAHEIAIRLGLKPRPEQPNPSTRTQESHELETLEK